MAQRRMFSPQIVESEEFLTMPISSQALYFHLGMNADDDGFIQPKIVMRQVGSADDDIKVLLTKRFLLEFDGGVVVIKHWLIHNLIQKDRYHPTRFQDEKKRLTIKENKAYTESVNNMLPEVRLGEVRLDINTPGKDTEDGVDIQKLLEEGQMQQFQDMGLQIYEKTNAPKNKKGECFRLAKLYPSLIQPSLRFSLDYPNPSLKWKMFLWKLNDLRKNEIPK